MPADHNLPQKPVVMKTWKEQGASDRQIDNRQVLFWKRWMAQEQAEGYHNDDDQITFPGLKSKNAAFFWKLANSIDVFFGNSGKTESISKQR